MAFRNRRRDGISRRGVLLGAGAAAGSALLDGCAAKVAKPVPNPEVNGVDADLLDEVFMLENTIIAAYAHVAGSLRGRAGELARTIGGQELVHARNLAAVIHSLGGRPSAGPADYGFPTIAGSDAGLAFVSGIESRLIAAYIDVVPKISSIPARAFAVSILANEAQHLALLNQVRGLPVAPQAIVRGAA